MNHSALAKLAQDSYTHCTYNIGECECMIKYFNGVQVVVFRGTETGALFAGAGWRDVLRDLRILPWHDKHAGWCHAGFLKGGRKVAKFLESHLNKDLPVICTGHSLGGALALICAVKLQAAGFNLQEWVGFGSPKVQLTKKQYRFNRINYQYRADIVPLMPRYTPYKHPYLVVQKHPCPFSAYGWDDHAIEHYVRVIR